MTVIHETNDIIVEKEGKVLLIKRGSPPEKGKWAPPGGHMDPGENPWEAAQREAQEEAGEIKVEKGPADILMHDVLPGEPEHPEPHRHKCYIFRGSVAGKVKAGSDAAEFRWFYREELKDLELTDYAEQTLRRLGYI